MLTSDLKALFILLQKCIEDGTTLVGALHNIHETQKYVALEIVRRENATIKEK